MFSDETIKALATEAFKNLLAADETAAGCGNLCVLIAEFPLEEQPLMLVSYSGQSGWDYELQYKLGLVSAVGGPAPFAQQANDQARNHTEPKLFTELDDEYLSHDDDTMENPVAVWLVTDRDVCPTCLSGTVKPFAKYAADNKIAFVVFENGNGAASGRFDFATKTVVV